MNICLRNAEYKMKSVVEKLNRFFPESAGSVENCTLSDIDSAIEDLEEAKQLLTKSLWNKTNDESKT